MKLFPDAIIFLILSVLLTSCLKQEESITPIADIRTLAQLQKESMMNTALIAAGNTDFSSASQSSVEISNVEPDLFYLNLKYNIEKLDVYETAQIPNSFEQLGHSFLKFLATVFLKISGTQTINIGAVNIPIPDLNLDFQIVKSIKVKKVFLKYNNELGDFTFINSLKISQIDNTPLFTYKKSLNHCSNKCLDFSIVNENVLDLFKDRKSINLIPLISISSFPKINELILDGEIDLQIGLKLPF